jgi:transcriptional regulator of heat shock response
MPEELEVLDAPAEEPVGEEQIETETDVTEEPSEGVDDEEEVDIGNVSLSDITDPQLRRFAKQLQGDYTRKTQSLADSRKQLEQYASFMAQKARELEDAGKKAVNEFDYDSATPEQITRHIVDTIEQRLQAQIAPIQQKLSVSEYSQQLSQMSQNEPLFADEAVRQKAAQIATSGLTPEAVLKAAAYDSLKAEINKLRAGKATTKAAAAKQGVVSGATATTKPGTQYKSMREAFESVRADLEAGKL